MTTPAIQTLNGNYPSDPFPFELMLDDFDDPPNGVKATFDYGDGSVLDTFTLNTLTPSRHTYAKRYVL